MKARDIDVYRELTRLNNELINVQRELSAKNAELIKMNQEYQKILAEMKTLKSLIPICMYCRKLKDDSNEWIQLEEYLSKHSSTNLSHGICDNCLAEMS